MVEVVSQVSSQTNNKKLLYWEELMALKIDLVDTLLQVKQWVDIKYCRCSLTPTRDLLTAALKGELWEKYRLLWWLDPIKDADELADMFDDLLTTLIKEVG